MMKKLLLCLALGFSSIAYAAKPSEPSVRELLAIAGAESELDVIKAQFEGMLQQYVEMVIPKDQRSSPEDQEMLKQMTKSFNELMQDELSWKVIEPIYINAYRESYTQPDIDAMLKFYKSKTGQSVAKKTATLSEQTMTLLQNRMAEITPKVMQTVQEARAKMEKDGSE